MTALTFFAEPALKTAVRHRVAEHHRLDQIVQKQYWRGGRGCFIGCSLHSSDHDQFPLLLGLPEWLAYLGERIFEGLPAEDAPQFTLDLYDAIPVGVDPEPAQRRFLAWIILDEGLGVVKYSDDPRVRAVGEALADEDGEHDWEELRRRAADAVNAAYASGFAAFYAAANAANVAYASGFTTFYAAANAADAAYAAAAYAADAAAYATYADAAAYAADARKSFYGAAAAELIRQFSLLKPAEDATPSLPRDPQFQAYYRRVRAEARVD